MKTILDLTVEQRIIRLRRRLGDLGRSSNVKTNAIKLEVAFSQSVFGNSRPATPAPLSPTIDRAVAEEPNLVAQQGARSATKSRERLDGTA